MTNPFKATVKNPVSTIPPDCEPVQSKSQPPFQTPDLLGRYPFPALTPEVLNSCPLRSHHHPGVRDRHPEC